VSKSLDVTEIQLALSVVLIVTAVAGTEVRNLHFGDREVPETLDDSSSYYSGVGMRNVAVFLGVGGGGEAIGIWAFVFFGLFLERAGVVPAGCGRGG